MTERTCRRNVCGSGAPNGHDNVVTGSGAEVIEQGRAIAPHRMVDDSTREHARKDMLSRVECEHRCEVQPPEVSG